jgi:hypothetical protein
VSDEWVVVGSGPSAKDHLAICEGRKVACVNASLGVVSHADAYGVFELEAFPVFAGSYARALGEGAECFTRKSIEKAHAPGGKTVPLSAGYDASSWGMEGVAFNSAGVAMLNAIAFYKAPAVIHMLGFDGYEGDDKFTRTRNSAMSLHIERITNLYRKTKFVLYGKSNMPRQDRWRVEHAGLVAGV